MKVVVNKCYGGYGLSDAAKLRLVGRCEHIELMEPEKYYGDRDGWREKLAADQTKAGLFGVVVHEGKIVLDEHDRGGRACPELVKVVEEMGAAANGRCADLHITEIPDGVNFIIDEYDGMEHVAEEHRTW